MLPFFLPDYAPAIVFPAHETNVLFPSGHGGVPNQPRAFFVHTPEEPVDGYPGTPHWFQTPNIYGSTQYFVSAQADPKRPGFTNVYQMVPESLYCYANGLTAGREMPAFALPGTSLNWQTNHAEVEGKADTIHETLIVGGPQWRSLVHLIRDRARANGYPLDRDHVLGHYQVSNSHYDPGTRFPWDALMTALHEGEEDTMNRYQGLANEAFFHGRGVTTSQNIWTKSPVADDWNLPDEAVSMLVTVYLEDGSLDLLDGDTRKAGFCFGRATTHRVRRGDDPNRSIHLAGAPSGVIDKIECLAWFAS